MSRDPELARRLWRRLELIHMVTYFCPEPVAALKEAGYKGYWMGYFAQRSAPLGPVGPEVVTALFYNFAPAHVARAIPDAWSFAPPSAALDARLRGSVAALGRIVEAAGIRDAVVTAAPLARLAAESAPIEGRALAAAHAGLPWPVDEIGTLWHAASVLREHRGDGHVAALTAAGIRGREANVLQVASGRVSKEILYPARNYDDPEWDGHLTGLAARGLVDDDGALTAAGKQLKDDIEERTDRAALTAYEALDDDQLDTLLDAVLPIARAIAATGEIPPTTPVGFLFDE